MQCRYTLQAVDGMTPADFAITKGHSALNHILAPPEAADAIMERFWRYKDAAHTQEPGFSHKPNPNSSKGSMRGNVEGVQSGGVSDRGAQNLTGRGSGRAK